MLGGARRGWSGASRSGSRGLALQRVRLGRGQGAGRLAVRLAQRCHCGQGRLAPMEQSIAAVRSRSTSRRLGNDKLAGPRGMTGSAPPPCCPHSLSFIGLATSLEWICVCPLPGADSWQPPSVLHGSTATSASGCLLESVTSTCRSWHLNNTYKLWHLNTDLALIY